MKKWEEKKEEENHLIQHQLVLKKEEKLRSKYLYKITLILLKYTPILIATIDFIHTLCAYYGIKIEALCQFFGGISVLSLLFMYIASYTFQFCELHRIPLHYIVVTNILATIDGLVGIPMNNLEIFRVYLIITGLFIIIYLYVKNNKKSIKTNSR